MKQGRKRRVTLSTLCLFSVLSILNQSLIGVAAQSALTAATPAIKTADLQVAVNDFLGRELAAHLAAIQSLNPPPDRILGVPTTGEFSWGTFMRSLAAYADSSGKRELAGRDIAKWVGQIGLIEARAGSKAFSQLYAALALRHFGRDLKTNPLWQGLSTEEQAAWRSLLNPERFYDPKNNKVINLPENYLGVASRIASIGFELGVSSDRVFLDRLLDRAAIQFTSGKLFADDSPPTGRYDRYSNEYARYVWEAAETAGRKDILDKLRPSLKIQMRLWWDLVSPDGYGYNWGRSQGIVSYLDTPEIAGFLAKHPAFRPASLSDIAALYYQAWQHLERDYRADAHLLTVFGYGRGNYSYITREREWQQTTGFFGKLANSHTAIIGALEREGITSFPTVPTLPEVARFEFFRKEGDRVAGVWLVRQGSLQFALPITTGTKPGVSDYLPAPHGLAGFAAPVEQTYPALVPYLELSDGHIILAGDGADAVEPSTDGQSLRVRWTHWAQVGTKSGELSDPGLTSEVNWQIHKDELFREEILTATRPVTIRHWKLAVPSSYAKVETEMDNGARVDRLSSSDRELQVTFAATGFQFTTALSASGDGPLSKGVRGPIPLNLLYEAHDLTMQTGSSIKTRLIMSLKSTSRVTN